MEKKLLTVKVSDLKPYENNPRNNDGAIEAVKESIKQVGYISPIIVDENNEILAGHTRYKSITEMNVETVEVMQVGGCQRNKKGSSVFWIIKQTSLQAGIFQNWS